jgi:hypothetical protein
MVARAAVPGDPSEPALIPHGTDSEVGPVEEHGTVLLPARPDLGTLIRAAHDAHVAAIPAAALIAPPMTALGNPIGHDPRPAPPKRAIGYMGLIR